MGGRGPGPRRPGHARLWRRARARALRRPACRRVAGALGGILPTPAVALLAGEDGCGAVISASHNPPEYNGVKFFGPGGWKLADEEEIAIEALVDLAADVARDDPRWPEPDVSLRERYEDAVVERFGGPLDGLRIACDCANGALAGLAPRAFERLGATVTAVGDEPDGTNINVGCGATDLGALQEIVRTGDFDLGVAFDGDGDRMLAVDAAGERWTATRCSRSSPTGSASPSWP